MKSIIPTLVLLVLSAFSVAVAQQYDHKAQAIEHLKAAVAQSEAVDSSKSLTEAETTSDTEAPPPNPLEPALQHLKEASKHANAALDETSHPSIEEALLHLNVAIEHARLRHPAETTQHAREAITFLEAAH